MYATISAWNLADAQSLASSQLSLHPAPLYAFEQQLEMKDMIRYNEELLM